MGILICILKSFFTKLVRSISSGGNDYGGETVVVRPEPNHNQIVKPLHAKSLLPCPPIPWQFTPIAINLHSSILLLLLRSCWYPVCHEEDYFRMEFSERRPPLRDWRRHDIIIDRCCDYDDDSSSRKSLLQSLQSMWGWARVSIQRKRRALQIDTEWCEELNVSSIHSTIMYNVNVT